jgi:hypothetical protein
VVSRNKKRGLARGLIAASCAIVFLSACQNEEKAGPPILNGSWASSDGVYVAEFLNGNFQAVANDTGGVISRGEYVAVASDQVRLRWVGLVSGQANQAECTRAEPNRMDCVDANGNRFSLSRSI